MTFEMNVGRTGSNLNDLNENSRILKCGLSLRGRRYTLYVGYSANLSKNRYK